jgi:hypothetical protein
MGREDGTAGAFVMPAARSYAYNRPTTEQAIVVSDWMAAERADPWEGKKQSGKAYLGSPPLKRKQLQQLRELAQQHLPGYGEAFVFACGPGSNSTRRGCRYIWLISEAV